MAIVTPKPKKLRLVNHRKRTQRYEPIGARGKSTQAVPSAGKCVEAKWRLVMCLLLIGWQNSLFALSGCLAKKEHTAVPPRFSANPILCLIASCHVCLAGNMWNRPLFFRWVNYCSVFLDLLSFQGTEHWLISWEAFWRSTVKAKTWQLHRLMQHQCLQASLVLLSSQRMVCGTVQGWWSL